MKRSASVLAAVIAVFVCAATPVFAGFAGTDLFLPSVGNRPGNSGSQWYTLLWIYNPGSAPANVRVWFLQRNVANPSPPTFDDTIPAGGTNRYPDVITDKFHVSQWGALRITSPSEVVVTCRMYNLPPGATDADTQGQDYVGVPASFAIGSGQSTELLGVYQTTPLASSVFRYSFGWVETAGGTANVRVTAYNEDGSLNTTSKDYPTTQGYEARYYDISDLIANVNVTNVRLKVEVTGGSGKVVAVGSGVANSSNDGTTFEMQFADSLLGGGLSAVAHDATLTGDGTSGNLLGIANGGVGPTQLADGSITDAKVATGIAYSKLSGAPSSLPPSGPAGGFLSGTYPSPTIANGVVGNAQLAANAVTSDKIADGTITTADLANAAVTKTKLSPSGGGNGQMLGTDGTNLVWQSPPGLTLPYSSSIASSSAAFAVGNTGSGVAMLLSSNTAWALEVGSSAGSGITASAAGTYGLYATANGSGGIGVRGVGPTNGTGVRGDGNPGVAGYGNGGWGVYGQGAHGAAGVYGVSDTNSGVYGMSTSGAGAYGTGVPGVSGNSSSGDGVHGVTSGSGVSAVYGLASQSTSNGVTGANNAGSTYGALATGKYGVYGNAPYIPNMFAGYFDGAVTVNGFINCFGAFYASGNKSFLIDHPLDPENKLLAHAAVESSEVLNIYSGNVRTDADGLAVVQLPNWFEALNTDFRYQLTVIGRFAQAIVEQEIKDNRFTIRTNLASVKVSWQVMAKRNDAWMKTHPFEVERAKPEAERGSYFCPSCYGQPDERGAQWATRSEMMRRIKQEQASRPATQN